MKTQKRGFLKFAHTKLKIFNHFQVYEIVILYCPGRFLRKQANGDQSYNFLGAICDSCSLYCYCSIVLVDRHLQRERCLFFEVIASSFLSLSDSLTKSYGMEYLSVEFFVFSVDSVVWVERTVVLIE